MALLAHIAQSYRHPRQALRAVVGGEAREDRALAVLMSACIVIFVSRWPLLAARADQSEATLQQLVGASLMAIVFIAPLILYLLAGLARLLARPFGGRASGYQARMALFRALLLASPLWLIEGALGGAVGPGIAQALAGAAALGAFVFYWGAGIRETESASPAKIDTPAPGRQIQTPSAGS